MGLQIERVTPFLSEQACFDYRVIDRDPGKGQISVELTAVAKSYVKDTIAAAERLGLAPQIVDVAHDGPLAPPLRNLLSDREATTSAGLWSPANRILAATAVALLIVLAVLPLAERMVLANRLSIQVTEARSAAEQVLALRERLTRAERHASFLPERKRSIAARAVVIEQLSRALPDDAWIFQMEISGSGVEIRGYGRDGAALVGRLADTEGFGRPRFLAPLTKDRETGLDRFELAFGLEP